MREFCPDKHAEFVLSLDNMQEQFEYHVTEHLRMSGVYWAVSSMALMGKLGMMDKQKILDFVQSCQHPNGGFGGSVGHDPHLLYTLSAVQILAIFGEIQSVDKQAIAKYVWELQMPDGAFIGDTWGEVDTRFSYCALNCLALLNDLGEDKKEKIDKAVEFVLSCKNFDEGFGSIPGAESHAGQIFCAVGALAIANSLDRVDKDALGWWLAERQLPCGGLNGRPEKKEDVCYSWWVLSSMSMLGKLEWINHEKLAEFILNCQDMETGGIADRPGDISDVFHTFFGIAGLSLLNFDHLEPVDPVFALPKVTTSNLNLNVPYQSLPRSNT